MKNWGFIVVIALITVFLFGYSYIRANEQERFIKNNLLLFNDRVNLFEANVKKLDVRIRDFTDKVNSLEGNLGLSANEKKELMAKIDGIVADIQQLKSAPKAVELAPVEVKK
ncbi:MAG TPA: hypothetical protein PKL77_02210 [Candidatus Omnitrophota bacterium]|nr:hypothetical protein [Candidatus Omnitrophota bacterium]HPT06976.1 hypothetical protein [Candidatus Omnitrophota bacterium]